MIENPTESLPPSIAYAHVSKTEYINVIRSNSPQLGAPFLWLTEQVRPQMSKDELGHAFELASQELRHRLDSGYTLLRPNVSLVRGSDQYAYRVISRDTVPINLGYGVCNTLERFYQNLNKYGIDYPGSAVNISPRTFWFHCLVERPGSIRAGRGDIVLIMMYHNKEFVLPNSARNEYVQVVHLSGQSARGDTRQIQRTEAMAANLPNLIDLLVGVLEIDII